MFKFRTNYATSVRSHFDALIDDHAYRYLDVCHQIKAFDRFDESVKSGTDVHYIGMVWNDGQSVLDIKELPLRGSQSLTDNAKVSLDLSEVSQEFSFFPGQIIAFTGRPSYERSKHLVVRNMIDTQTIQPPFPDKEFTLAQPMRIIVVSGPFVDYNDNGDINNKSLNILLEACEKAKPSHIILIGPFVNSESKERLLKSPREFSEDFNTFLTQVHAALKDSSCTIYLVSSPKDLMSESMMSANIYPCPGISIKTIAKDKKKSNLKIISTTDPSHLNLNGLTISVTSADVLFHLSSSEVTMNRSTNDRMVLLSRHLLNQANMYPIYPPKHDLSVDYSVVMNSYKLERSPHILIAPSRLQCFHKQVNGCLVINPQRPPAGNLRQFVQIDLAADKSYSGSLIDSLQATIVKLTEVKSSQPPMETQKSDEMDVDIKTSSSEIVAESL